MAPIRIALASLPQLLHDIVVPTLSSEPDMEIVGEASGPGQLSAVVRESSADVVIAACERLEVESLARLINGSPSTLLAITDEGRRGVLYQLCPKETDLGEISPRELVNAIRGAVKKTAT
jgi:DNA-binding NarL/FixJ family response regulator